MQHWHKLRSHNAAQQLVWGNVRKPFCQSLQAVINNTVQEGGCSGTFLHSFSGFSQYSGVSRVEKSINKEQAPSDWGRRAANHLLVSSLPPLSQDKIVGESQQMFNKCSACCFFCLFFISSWFLGNRKSLRRSVRAAGRSSQRLPGGKGWRVRAGPRPDASPAPPSCRTKEISIIQLTKTN